jgi:hypothetical protein
MYKNKIKVVFGVKQKNLDLDSHFFLFEINNIGFIWLLSKLKKNQFDS